MSKDVVAEVAGTVWTVDVELGSQVKAGESVMTVESMKMEIPVEAATSGTIRELLVGKGDPVEEGQIVARLG